VLTVLLLALASATSAACSTAAKHQSTRRPYLDIALAHRLPRLLATMIASPWWLAGLVFDLGAIGFQVFALRYGDLSVVQPVLTVSLLISLVLSHLLERTRIRKTEVAYGLLLIAGLVVFLASSGSLGPHGEESIGAKVPGIILSVLAGTAVLICLGYARRVDGRRRARALAVVTAIMYVAMAGLIKSSTRIADLRGWESLLTSWQLWGVVGCALGAMLAQQVAYGAAPLAQSLPVVASLDPLFAVTLGVVVYGESLRHGPLDLSLEFVGLAALLVGVLGISRLSAAQDGATAARPHDIAARPRHD